MVVAQNMEIRYPRADLPCNIQDDKEDMAAQIGQMDGIYGNAIVTIVAATSHDLRAGISQGVQNSRSVDQLAGEVCSAPVVNVRGY